LGLDPLASPCFSHGAGSAPLGVFAGLTLPFIASAKHVKCFSDFALFHDVFLVTGYIDWFNPVGIVYHLTHWVCTILLSVFPEFKKHPGFLVIVNHLHHVHGFYIRPHSFFAPDAIQHGALNRLAGDADRLQKVNLGR
jgi:hypothetical protein